MEKMKFKDSALAHKYLDGLEGIEIGGGAHNPFGLNTKNVDYSDDMDQVFKDLEFKMCGEKMPVDIVAPGDDLPLEDESIDFVVSSHVIEHFFDPIGAIKEWLRVIKKGGYIFIIAPHQNADPLETRPITTVDELIKRHSGEMKPEDVNMKTDHNYSVINGMSFGDSGHWSVWDMGAFIKMCNKMDFNIIDALDIDDKVGNGFCIVIQK